MFSIARFTGEEEDHKDNRSFEKKKERLDKLNARIKKRKDDSVENTSEKKIKLQDQSKEKKAKESKPETTKEEIEEEANDEEENSLEESHVEEGEREATPVQEEETSEPMEVDVPTLEAFPEMALPKTKHSKEEKKLLKSMGIPEWLLQPTVVSPKSSCDLDKVGLSEHILQRCQDLGLSSLFAVQMAVIPVFLRRQALYDTRRVPGDLCISAPTGSGKTMAYVLPIVDILSKRVVTRLRAVVVLPTRDLVTQVKETFDAFVKGTNLVVAAASGQQSFAHEQQVLVGNHDQRYIISNNREGNTILNKSPIAMKAEKVGSIF